MDEVCRRAVTLAAPRRFVCLTFDGAYKDLMTSAYPVLSRHRVPFTVYVPTAFPDGLGEAWWLALEAVIARENRISLVMDRKERRFDIADVRKISALRFSRRLDALACRRRSVVRDQGSLQALFGRPRRAVAPGLDGLDDLATLAPIRW
jgi:peptidoglycan/xylan/chitin deacetylase (PgdA/CDA1 family)